MNRLWDILKPRDKVKFRKLMPPGWDPGNASVKTYVKGNIENTKEIARLMKLKPWEK